MMVAVRVGDRVMGNFDEKGKYYPGTVTACNENGTFAITYDDGDKEKEVRAHNIRAAAGSQALAGSPGRSPKKGSPKKGSPSKSGTPMKSTSAAIPAEIPANLRRFWSLLLQGLQCKCWRIEHGSSPIAVDDQGKEVLAAARETSEVLWMIHRPDEPPVPCR